MRAHQSTRWKRRIVFCAVSLSFFAGLWLLTRLTEPTGHIQPVPSVTIAPLSATLVNAHTLQTMLDTYGVEHGQYPVSLKALEIEAQKKGEFGPYWKILTNPYTRQVGYGKAFTDAGQPPVEGIVLYQPVLQTAQHGKTEVLGYAVYAYKSDTERIQDQGRDFFLSNS